MGGVGNPALPTYKKGYIFCNLFFYSIRYYIVSRRRAARLGIGSVCDPKSHTEPNLYIVATARDSAMWLAPV